MDVHRQQLDADGFTVFPDIVADTQCDQLNSHLQAFERTGAGSRTLLRQPWCVELAHQLRRHPILYRLLPRDGVAVQCTLFDKSLEKNWLVSLHQDLSIPVKSRVDSPDCSGWSEKEGYLYVQPPAQLLEQIIAVRVHVDPCPPESGPLRVVPGSHAFGRLNAVRLEQLRKERGEVVVPVPRGGALVMRPLLLHASSKASHPTPRRVLHFVFGPAILPLGLEWQYAV
jgi:hypothetical protein